jgi:hypothetical protein
MNAFHSIVRSLEHHRKLGMILPDTFQTVLTAIRAYMGTIKHRSTGQYQISTQMHTMGTEFCLKTNKFKIIAQNMMLQHILDMEGSNSQACTGQHTSLSDQMTLSIQIRCQGMPDGRRQYLISIQALLSTSSISKPSRNSQAMAMAPQTITFLRIKVNIRGRIQPQILNNSLPRQVRSI